MPHIRALSGEERRRRRVRAFKKQARKTVRRRAKIMAGLDDPLLAAFIDAFLHDSGATGYVPLLLVPMRQLRRRVQQLNLETRLYGAASTEAVAPESIPPAATTVWPTVGPLPAQRIPRRRGDRPIYPAFPLLPFMADQPHALDDILHDCGALPLETGIGRRHRCLFCQPMSSEPPLADPLTLCVYPTAVGDLAFRCHRCGSSLDSVEYVCKRSERQTLVQAADYIRDHRYLRAPLPPAQLAGYERLAFLRKVFSRGLGRLSNEPLYRGRVMPFCQWSLVRTDDIREIFSDQRVPKELPVNCLMRISQDIYGRWSALHLHQPKVWSPLYRLELRDWEPPAACTFFLPRGAEHLSARELILCQELNLAWTLETAVAQWPEEKRVPVALLDRCTGPLAEPFSPYSRIWAVVQGSRTAKFALPLCAPTTIVGEPEVRVRRLPEHFDDVEPSSGLALDPMAFCNPTTATECVQDYAGCLAAEARHQPITLVMSEALRDNQLHPETRRRLVEAVSTCTGMTPTALVDEKINPWTGGPYALNAVGGTTYVARGGQYWRRGRRDQEFSAVSNFELRLLEDRIDTNGRVTHHVSFEIGGQSIPLSFSTSVLESAKQLMKRLTREASVAGAEYPYVMDTKAKRLLPDLVKATQERPHVIRAQLSTASTKVE